MSDTAKLIAQDVLANPRDAEVCRSGECFYPTVLILARALEAAEAERDEEHERNRRWLFEDEHWRTRTEAAKAHLTTVAAAAAALLAVLDGEDDPRHECIRLRAALDDAARAALSWSSE